MPLTTLAMLKSQAGIASNDTSRDPQLRSLIEGVTSLIQQQLHRDIESKEYVEYYSGDGTPFLLLRQFPVTEVLLVRVDETGYFGESALGSSSSRDLVQGIDYVLMSGSKGVGSSGILRRLDSTWRTRSSRTIGILEDLPGIPRETIMVRYTAGFEVIPPAISMALNSLIIRLAAQAQLGSGVQSMSYEDAAVSYMSSTDIAKVTGSIESILANYRSTPI